MTIGPDPRQPPALRGQAALQRALAEAAGLLAQAPPPGSPEARRFDALLRRIEAYQPEPGADGAAPSPIGELERHLRDAAGRTAERCGAPWRPMVGGDLRGPGPQRG